MWISTLSSGVFLVAERGLAGHFHAGTHLPSNRECALGLTRAGEVLIGTPQGFLTVDGEHWTHTMLAPARRKGTGLVSQFLDTAEGLWVTATTGVFLRSPAGEWRRAGIDAGPHAGLAELDGDVLVFSRRGLFFRQDSQWWLREVPVYRLMTLAGGQIVFANDEGLWCTIPEGLRSDAAEGWCEPISFLPDDRWRILSLYEGAGTLWAGYGEHLWRSTDAGMVPAEPTPDDLEEAFRWSEPSRHGCGWTAPARSLLRHWQGECPLPGSLATSFQETRSHLFVATDRGLARWTPAGWSQDEFCRETSAAWAKAGEDRERHADATRAKEVFRVAETPDGTLAACTWGWETLRVHRWRDGRLETLPHAGLPQHPPTGFLGESDGTLLVASAGGGVSRWDGRTWVRQCDGLPSLDLQFLGRDGTGRLWTGDWHSLAVQDGERWQVRVAPAQAVARMQAADGCLLLQESSGRFVVLDSSGTHDPGLRNVKAFVAKGQRTFCLAAPPEDDADQGVFEVTGRERELLFSGRRLPAVDTYEWSDLTVSPDGRFWMATMQGLFELPIPPLPSGPEGAPLAREAVDRRMPPPGPAAPPPQEPSRPSARDLPPLVRRLQARGLLGAESDLSDWDDEEPEASALSLLVEQRGFEADYRDIGGPFLERILALSGLPVTLLEYPAEPETWDSPVVVRVQVDGRQAEWRIPAAAQMHEAVAGRLNRLLAAAGAPERLHVCSPGDATWFILMPPTGLDAPEDWEMKVPGGP